MSSKKFSRQFREFDQPSTHNLRDQNFIQPKEKTYHNFLKHKFFKQKMFLRSFGRTDHLAQPSQKFFHA